MYDRLPSFVIGFHGCDKETRDKILYENTMSMSRNRYDWLGHGVYFWEQNIKRAMEFAEEARGKRYLTQGEIKTPAVLGAVIDLGNCANLLDSDKISRVSEAYRLYKTISEALGKPMENNIKGRRNLDCAVIETLHRMTADAGLLPYDTVRAMYPEGNPLYEGAGFYDKSHIQICVCNRNCIKALFDPRSREISDIAW